MRFLKALPLALVGMLWTTLAFAGSLRVTDEAHLLSSSDVSGLQATAARWSFDTHLLISVAPAKAALENRAKAWVDAPNVVVIALDPEHHHVIARFGVGSNVKTMDFDSISAAGNPAFREHQWRTGIEAIGSRADVSARMAVGTNTVAPQAPIVVHEGFGFWGWAAILAGAGFLVWIALRLYRKSQRDSERFQRALDDNRVETASLAGRNIREADYEAGITSRTIPQVRSSYTPSIRTSGYVAAPAPVVVAPAPAASSSVTVVNNGGGGGIGGNGFVEGMLVGELMHDHHDTVIRERDVYVERPVYTPPSAPSAPAPATTYDSGGSSGSYDSGGSSSSYGSSSGSSSSYSGSSYSSSNDSGSSGSSSDWSSSSSSDSGSSSSYDSGSGSSSSDSGGSSSDF